MCCTLRRAGLRTPLGGQLEFFAQCRVSRQLRVLNKKNASQENPCILAPRDLQLGDCFWLAQTVVQFS